MLGSILKVNLIAYGKKYIMVVFGLYLASTEIEIKNAPRTSSYLFFILSFS